MILLKFHGHFESEILLTRQLKSTRYLKKRFFRVSAKTLHQNMLLGFRNTSCRGNVKVPSLSEFFDM